MIRTDSRKVQPGDTFVALSGVGSNGADYIDSAIANGAVRIVCSEGTYDVETINTPDTRKYLEELLVSEYGDIVSQMKLIGVTGTNGKTSTCYMISRMLTRLGYKCAYIGTIGFYLGEKVCSLPNTSVDICHLYELLLQAHEAGYDYVALEASSQGLDKDRLNTINFDVAAFTNLTEEHLDYHKTFESYALCKQRLFKQLKSGAASVINIDDQYYRYFLPEDGKGLITYGFGESDFQILDFSGTKETTLRFKAYGKEYTVTTDMIGVHNMYNLITCMACINALGIPMDDIVGAVDAAELPEGRMEVYNYKNSRILIDYAHTPDGFEKIFSTIKALKPNKIYSIFGCCGERERGKRPKMTRIALENSDHLIISSDDLFNEEPEHILKDMLEGNEAMTNYEICMDRPAAIRKAMAMLGDGDFLLLLGLGHQQTINVKGVDIHHNDKEIMLEVMAEEN